MLYKLLKNIFTPAYPFILFMFLFLFLFAMMTQIRDEDSELRGSSWLLQEVYRGVLQDSSTPNLANQEGPPFCMD